jgi:hypothetical protein
MMRPRTPTAASMTASAAKAAPPVAPAVPLKVRRRPAFLIGSVATLLLGALAGAWLWVSATSTVEVLVARTTLARGSVIGAEDLVRVRIGVDPAVHAIPAEQAASLVGKRAALDISAGGLVTPEGVADQVVPPKGMALVGLSLGNGLLPSSPLQAGDQVRIVPAPATPEQLTATPTAIAATVVAIARTADGQAALVDVLVPSPQAAGLAAQAAASKVALVLDSRER